MQKGFHLRIALPSVLASALLTASCGVGPAAAESGRDPVNLYREGESSYLGSATSAALPRVSVPNVKSVDVYVIDPASYKVIGYFKVGRHPQHVVPSWNLKTLSGANNATRHAPGSVSVIEFATRSIVGTWEIPDGGSPDMGNVSADGKRLWLSGRFDNVVYAFDTSTGAVKQIPVGHEPQGRTVWPQPGRYSLGHTGIMR